MTNIDIGQGRTWSRDGKYVVEYRSEATEQTFERHIEEYMDMVSGKIRREEVRYPMRSVVFTEDDVGKRLKKATGAR